MPSSQPLLATVALSGCAVKEEGDNHPEKHPFDKQLLSLSGGLRSSVHPAQTFLPAALLVQRMSC